MAQPPAGRGAGSREVTEQRREQILQAALEVIVERGYAETRIADVAERAGRQPRAGHLLFQDPRPAAHRGDPLLARTCGARPAPGAWGRYRPPPGNWPR